MAISTYSGLLNLIIYLTKYKPMDIVCLQLPYRKKEITTRELTKRKQMGAYTGPTKGQRTASRKGIKTKYK
jgi:hypothetical protein